MNHASLPQNLQLLFYDFFFWWGTAICVPLSVIMCMQAQYNINGYRYLRQPVPRLSVRHGVEVFLSWPKSERTLLRFLTWVRDEGVLGEDDYMRVCQRHRARRAVDVPRYRIISFWRVDPNTPDFEEIILQALFDSPVIGHFPITDEYDYTGEVNIRFRGGGQLVELDGVIVSHGDQAGIDGFMELNQDPLEGVYIIRVSS